MVVKEHGYSKTEYTPEWIYSLAIISDEWSWTKEEEEDSFEL
jgi:hypothetical protein